MRFLLIVLTIVVLIAGCGGSKSSVLDDTSPLQDQLVAEFNRQMSMTWVPDMAPTSRFDEETRILFWCLRGDYNLSGEVGVSDITPIGQYFNQPVDPEVNPALVEGAPWWVDGNSDGLIAIHDITPIAQSFQQRAFWWKSSVGWGEPLGGFSGLFYVLIPEDIDPETIVLKISSEPPPVETPENRSPIAILQATPDIGNAPLTVEFDASVSIDLDGNVVSYELDWEGDGVYDFVSDSASTTSHTYPTVGSFHARLRVMDDGGAVGTDDQLIMVTEPGNLPPVAMLSVSPTSGIVPLTITLDASESYDLDGEIITVEWDLQGDGTYDATSVGLDSTQPRDWPYNTAGVFTPRIRVTDDDGAQGIAIGNVITIIESVPFNRSPAASISASPYSGDAPLAVLFDASASVDPDGDIIRYDYDFNDDGIWDAYDSGSSVEWTYESPGYYQVIVRVTDNDGAKSLAGISSIQVNAVGNELPSARLTAAPTYGYAPLLVNFDASASSDPDGSIVRYDYDFNGDGIWDAYDSGSQVQWEYNTAGIFITIVRVTDNTGAQSTAVGWVRVNVVGNQVPIADLVANPTLGNAPLSVLFDASASSDPDGTIMQYDFDFNGDGIWDAYDANSIVNWTYYSAGIFNATVRVTDNNGAQDTDVVEVTVNVVGNELPVADLQAIPSAGYSPLTVLFDASWSSDPDGTIVRYDYDFNNDGIWDAYDSGSTVNWTYYTAGIFDATVRVTDNNGAQDTATVEINVNIVSNEPPVADLTATPTSGNTPLLVHFDATNSVDPDGSIIQFDYDFNGDSIWDAYDANSIVNWTYYTAGTYTAKVRVTDDDGAQDSETRTILVDEPEETVGRGDWYMFGREPTQNRRSPFNGPQTATVKWRYPIGARVAFSSPAISADGTIYVGCDGPWLWAINPDGSFKWRFTASSRVNSSPAIGTDGTIFATSVDGRIFAVNPNGSFKWQYQLLSGGEVSSPTIGTDGTIYVGANTSLYAFYQNGAVKWENYSVRPTTICASIAADGTIYVGSYDRYLYAINQDGSTKWRYAIAAPGALYGSPAIGADGTIYVGGRYDNFLHAINPNGTLKWRYTMAGYASSGCAIGADGTIYIGGGYADGSLTAVNPNGTLKWRYPVGYSIYSSPAIGADGTIYVGCDGPWAWAFNPDGSLKWCYYPPGGGGMDVSITSPSIGEDGTLYMGGNDQYLYAFHD